MNPEIRTEVEQKLAEVKPLQEAAWKELQDFEASDSYKEMKRQHEALNNTWYTFQTQQRALEAILK